MTDDVLVDQALAGQTSAYELLVRRWVNSVLALCRTKIRCRHTAEDLTQEAFLRGFRNLSTLKDHSRFGPWVRGIAYRACQDWLKSKQSSQVPFGVLSEDQEPDHLLATSANSTEQIVEQKDEVERLLAEVDALPEEQREVILLYYYEQGTYDDLARLLGVSRATVNARLTKARAALRERLQGARRA